MRRALLVTWVIGSISLLGGLAHADEKQICLDASENAQKARIASKLKAAREALLICHRDVCPGVVRQDCEKWLGEVIESLPSVVIAARDASGHDLFDVQISVDGEPLADKIDGKALVVDPGARLFRFVRGTDVKEERVLVRQGEHNRLVEVTLGAAAPVSPVAGRGAPVVPASTSKPTLVPAAPEASSGPRKPIALAMVSGGMVGLGVAGVLGLVSNSDAATLRDTCGPTRTCTDAQVDAVSGKRTTAAIVAGVSGAVIVTGFVLYFTAPNAPRPNTARLEWEAVPLEGGAYGGVSGRF